MLILELYQTEQWTTSNRRKCFQCLQSIDIYQPTEERYTFVEWEGKNYDTILAHDITFVANISDGINGVKMNGSSAVVFSIDGRLISKNMKMDGLNKHLAPGIYIINGVKRVIK